MLHAVAPATAQPREAQRLSTRKATIGMTESMARWRCRLCDGGVPGAGPSGVWLMVGDSPVRQSSGRWFVDAGSQCRGRYQIGDAPHLAVVVVSGRPGEQLPAAGH